MKNFLRKTKLGSVPKRRNEPKSGLLLESLLMTLHSAETSC
jgi:hypothetical protein